MEMQVPNTTVDEGMLQPFRTDVQQAKLEEICEGIRLSVAHVTAADCDSKI